MKKLLLILLGLCCLTSYAQEKTVEVDNVAFLLGMLDYPRERLDNSQFTDVVQILSKKEVFMKDLLLQTISKIEGVKDENVTIKDKGKYIWIVSKPVINQMNSYLVFYPHTRRELLKKEFRDKNVLEGYINPYMFTPKQQESFVLGFLISKAKVNERDKKLYTEGDYEIKCTKSQMFFEIVSTFMKNTGFMIKSSEIRQHNYKYGYEVFFGRITVNIPPKYKKYIAKQIKLRDNN